MRKAGMTWVLSTLLLLLALAAAYHVLVRGSRNPEGPSPARQQPATSSAGGDQHGLLHGRVSTHDGAMYQGRLRWGDNEEAFWDTYFNGSKKENSWAAKVPPERLPRERHPITIFGFEIGERERLASLTRPFMARFGDISRIEARGRNVRVTLKSGTAIDLDRFEASDIDDGVRVWDGNHGVVDIDSGLIQEIEFFPAASPNSAAVPKRLHGTVRCRRGDFTGFVQWDEQICDESDQLAGIANGREIRLRFEAILSIERRPQDALLITLRDGSRFTLSRGNEARHGTRGIAVYSRRHGRLLISWDTFERVDFSPGPKGPAYDDFAPGSPLLGTVMTFSGGQITGRLVYDLDESETTDTLDAPSEGVDYTIAFGLIATIQLPGHNEPGPPQAAVTLHDGEELRLETRGDLGAGNAGILVFPAGRPHPEYVEWNGIARIDLDNQAKPR